MSDSALGDWGPVINGAIYKVFYDNGVPNADELAEKCAEALQSVVTSIRLEQMEVVIDRLTGMAREHLLSGGDRRHLVPLPERSEQGGVMTDESDVVAPLQAAEAATEERMYVLAIRCGVRLDPEDDPVTFADVRRAAADDCALRAAILHAPRVLPEGLADYLVRSWQVHTQTFDRVREMSDLEIAAGWGRRHAAAARSVLSMTDAAQPPTSEASPQ